MKISAETLRRKLFLFLCVAALSTLTFFVVGCSVPGDANTTTTNTTPAPVRPPVRVYIAPDFSKSMNGTNTAPIKLEDVAPLIELLQQTGGELAVGAIGVRGDLPLLRLRVDARPTEPQRPPYTNNGAEWSRRVNEYNEKRARYEREIARWSETVPPRIEAFQREFASLLARERVQTRSDVLGAVVRAEVFLNEPDDSWGQATRRYLVVISDGQDYPGASRPPRQIPPLRSGARLFIVNGIGAASPNSLSHLAPEYFEAMPAAVRQIVTLEGGTNQ